MLRVTTGHPPPSSRCLRTRLTERLTYLDDLVRVRLDDFLATDQQPDVREAYKHQIQQYIAQARSLLATLPAEADAPVDRVLMDVPVSVVDEETVVLDAPGGRFLYRVVVIGGDEDAGPG